MSKDKFNADKYLMDVLSKRDKNLGKGGNYSFSIAILSHNNSWVHIVSVQNLTEKAAKTMFDLFDENSAPLEGVNLMIEIHDHSKQVRDQIDMNTIPNEHTKQVLINPGIRKIVFKDLTA